MNTKKTLFNITAMCIAVIFLLWVSADAQAKTPTSFTHDTPFSIPDCNGTIYFASNGSYTQAKLENNTWVFSNLQLNTNSAWFFGIQRPIIPTPIESMRISAKNCNITITSLYLFNEEQSEELFNNSYFLRQKRASVRYNVTGLGTQTFNFGLSPTFGQNPLVSNVRVQLDLYLTNQSNINPQRDGWTILNDGTVNVTAAKTQALITCRDYSSQLIDEDLPFYQSHSVLTLWLVLVAGIVLIGVALRVKSTQLERTL
jgi:hypothetical protein